MSKSTLFPTAQMKSEGGIWLTRSLFLETAVADDAKKYVLFTLKDENYEGYQSFPNIYFALTENDPTEYEMAITLFGSWEHWLAVSESSTLKPVVAKLREEKNVKQKSKAIKYMLNEVAAKSNSSFQAAKLLLTKPWEDKEANTVKGRAAQKAKDKLEDSKVYGRTSSQYDDAKRLGLLDTDRIN